MREVLWVKSASRDLNALLSFIAEDSEQNANLVGERIGHAATGLGELAIGGFGRVQDTYELPVPKTPYIISYAKSETTITILRVIDEARNWEVGSWPSVDN
jgi:plasmid stabilization system protein ParE